MSTFNYRYEDQNIANWINYPSTSTPINQTNLRAINAAIQKLFEGLYTESRDKVTSDVYNTKIAQLQSVDNTKQDIDDTLTWIKDISYNQDTGVFRVTRVDDTSFSIDTKLEKLAVNFRYDGDPESEHYQNLIITLDDGTVQYVDMEALITEFDFSDSDTIEFKRVQGEDEEIIVSSETIGNKTENGASITFHKNTIAFEISDDVNGLVMEDYLPYFTLSGTATSDTIFQISILSNLTPGALKASLFGQTADITTEGQLVISGFDNESLTTLKIGSNELNFNVTQDLLSTYKAFYIGVLASQNTTYNMTKQSIKATCTSDGVTNSVGVGVPGGSITITDTVPGPSSFTADVKKHSIGSEHLQTNYLADITTQATNASNSASQASNKASQASTYATNAATSASSSNISAVLSQSWCKGGTNTRLGEDTDNAKYYAEKAEEACSSIVSALTPKGTITFANLPDLANVKQGWMYNISNDFTSDSRFKDGSGKSYLSGSNVYAIFEKAGQTITFSDTVKPTINVGDDLTIQFVDAGELHLPQYYAIANGTNTSGRDIIVPLYRLTGDELTTRINYYSAFGNLRMVGIDANGNITTFVNASGENYTGPLDYIPTSDEIDNYVGGIWIAVMINGATYSQTFSNEIIKISKGTLQSDDVLNICYDKTVTQEYNRYWDVLTPAGAPAISYMIRTLSKNSTTVTFQGIPSQGDYIFDIYTDKPNLGYTNIDTTYANSVSITFPAQSTDTQVYLAIKEVR